MQQHNFIADLKSQVRNGGMHVKLIFVNAIVFFCIGILTVIGRLISPEAQLNIQHLLTEVFTLRSNFHGFITHPWGLITSIFAHFTFMHFLFNMLMLFFVGKMFEHFFGAKKLLLIYIFGGLCGGLFEIIAHSLFPGVGGLDVVVVGASGSIMAIFIAVAVYRPQLQVNLFGVLPVKIIVLAGLYFLYDILSMGLNDGTAHFAHIGGAIFGFFAVQKVNTSANILVKLDKLFKQKPKKVKIIRGGGKKFTDEEFNADKIARQRKTDIILDKISKSGYESLTTEEKNFLFTQSKNG